MSSDDLPVSEYDRATDFYLDFLRERLADPDSFFHQNVDIMLHMLGGIAGAHICDLACGEGFLSRLLAQHGGKVVGIDLSANLLKHAQLRSRGRDITYRCDDAQALRTLGDESFDAVVCHMALMDIPDLQATVRAVRRVLKPGGRFVFCVLHPCFETPFDAVHPPHELDAADNLLAIRLTRYREEGKWFSQGSGMRGRLGSIHRTLSTYFNTLIEAGFTIAEIAEPTFAGQPADTLDKQLRSIAPRVLIVSANRT